MRSPIGAVIVGGGDGVLGVTVSNEDSFEVAQLCHNLAVVLGAVAELLHQQAGTILASVPTGGPHDRNRVAWAVEMAAEMRSKGRHEDAERVLLAALALSEGLFGRDDPQSIQTRRMFGAPGSWRGDHSTGQDASRA
jgi:hypothetical protein